MKYVLTCEMLGTLTVLRMKGLLLFAVPCMDWPPIGSKCLVLALINSLTATDWRNLKKHIEEVHEGKELKNFQRQKAYRRSSWRKRTRICSKTNLSKVKMVSTADTPRVYFSMKVSPSGPVTSSCPEAAITANDCLSSNSSEAWKEKFISLGKLAQ